MNDNVTQNNYYDRRAARRQRRMERRGGSWLGGLLLIGLGILLLIQNTGTISFGRWWSLLILIPAAAAFASALKEYQAAGGRLTGRASGALVSGLLLCLVTVALLFNLDWGWFGPALLLLAGLGFFVRGYADQNRE